MQCFNHQASSVGLCKYCHKALCIECVDFVRACVTCKTELCRQETEQLLLINDFSEEIRTTYGKKGLNYSAAFSRLFPILGILFVLYGTLEIFYGFDSYVHYLLICMGLIFIGPAVHTMRYNRQMPRV